jgi:ribonucleoside-triphosphate reductase (formate)
MTAKKTGVCNKETEVYSRIVGYFRPVSNWNKGKKQEFEDRKNYDVSVAKAVVHA